MQSPSRGTGSSESHDSDWRREIKKGKQVAEDSSDTIEDDTVPRAAKGKWVEEESSDTLEDDTIVQTSNRAKSRKTQKAVHEDAYTKGYKQGYDEGAKAYERMRGDMPEILGHLAKTIVEFDEEQNRREGKSQATVDVQRKAKAAYSRAAAAELELLESMRAAGFARDVYRRRHRS